jgi:hypothetical protein
MCIYICARVSVYLICVSAAVYSCYKLDHFQELFLLSVEGFRNGEQHGSI